jgi:hypothetical protein
VAPIPRAWVDLGQGRAIARSQAGRAGALGGLRLLPLDGTEHEREREGLGFKLNFLKILNRNFENESCRDLKIYDFHFGSKFI